MVLLHGQPGSRADWAGVVEELWRDHLVVVPDRLGYGETGGRAGGFAANAAALARLVRQCGLPAAVLVGHSWGGGVALQAAADFPAMVSGLVLVSSVHPGDRPGALDRLLARRIVGTTMAALTLSTAGTVMSWGPARSYAGRRAAHGRPENVREAARSARAWRRPSTWASFAAEQRALVHELPLLSTRVPSVPVPAAVVVGTADRVVPPGSGRRLAAALPGACLVEVDGAGHLVPQLHPGAVAGAVRQTELRARLLPPEPGDEQR